MALTAAVIAVAFVLPHWREYQFYNWQMTVMRKPSYALADIVMMALARDLVDRGAPMLNLLFHSSEAIVGGSPYNRTEAELSAFFDRLGAFFTFASHELRAEPLTFAEFRRAYTRQ